MSAGAATVAVSTGVFCEALASVFARRMPVSASPASSRSSTPASPRAASSSVVGHDARCTEPSCDQLHAYLDGERTAFDLPFRPNGSAYQRRVWDALRAIPYGETRTYAELASEAGGSARSVGGANRRNPLPILIPCHRVVAAGGVGGYSGGDGLDTKRYLLALEAGPAARNRPGGTAP